jgi:hypothetical protein
MRRAEGSIGASTHVMTQGPGLCTTKQADERRRGADRRTQSLRSLMAGHFNPRRRGPRRARDGSLASTDWFAPKWLVVAVLILLLSIADALLTLTLMQHGALEANPVMALLVNGDTGSFAAVKIGLTASGVVLLTVVSRVRAFGRVPVGAVLYAVLAGYAGLVAYELWLLRFVTNS